MNLATATVGVVMSLTGSQSAATIETESVSATLLLPSAATLMPLSAHWATGFGGPPILVSMPVVLDPIDETDPANPTSNDSSSANPAEAETDLTAFDDDDPTPLEAIGGAGISDGLTPADMALDWGTATIGPGVLSPQMMTAMGGGMFPPGAGQGSGGIGPQGPIVIDPPPPVPEPASILAWLVVAILGSRWWPRHPDRTATMA